MINPQQLIMHDENIQNAISQSFNTSIQSVLYLQMERKLNDQYMGLLEMQFPQQQQPPTHYAQLLNYLMCIVDKAVRDYEKEIRKLKQEHQIQIMDMEARKCDEMDKMKKRILVNERQKGECLKRIERDRKIIEQYLQQNRTYRLNISQLEESKRVLSKKISNMNVQIQKYMYQEMKHKQEIQELGDILEQHLIDLQLNRNNMQLQLLSVLQLANSQQQSINLTKLSYIQSKQSEVSAFIQSIPNNHSSHIGGDSDFDCNITHTQLALEDSQLYHETLEGIKKFVYRVIREEKLKRMRVQKQNGELRKRYSQFLQETDTKIVKLKQKNNRLQESYDAIINSKIGLQAKIKFLQQITQELQANITASNEEKYELQRQIQSKEKTINDYENRVKQVQEKYEEVTHRCQEKVKENEQIRLELLSVKDALQTLRSMKLEQETVCDDESSTASIIMEQMVDKTYHIRLQNLQYRQEIQALNESVLYLNAYVLELNNIILSYSALYHSLSVKQEENKVLKQQKDSKEKYRSLSNRKTGIKRNIRWDQQNNINQINYVPNVKNSKNDSVDNSLNHSVLQSSSIEMLQPMSISHTKTKKQDLLTKTCKINNSDKYMKSIENLNEVVNYMVNYAKGYTRNGIRKECWITGQGDQEYVTKVMGVKNIKQKYENYEKIRELCQSNSVCKQLISNYEQIINYYLVRI